MMTVGIASVSLAGAESIRLLDGAGSLRTVGGGWFHTMGGRPDTLQDGLVQCGQPAAWAWRIEVLEKAATQGVAAIIPLWNNLDRRLPAAARVTKDAVLTMHLIGELGQRRLRVLARDGRESAVELRVIRTGELDPQQWRAIPIELDAKKTGLKQLTGLRLEIEGNGPAWIAVQRIDAHGLKIQSQPAEPTLDRNRPMRRALWVWKTDELLKSEGNQHDLLAFCQRRAITDLFLQVMYTYDDKIATLTHVDPLRRFLKMAHEHQLRIHALDGAPRYALTENHPRMFALVDALRAFNQAGEAAERFDAVHLDNEPYVMEAWQDPAQRAVIIEQFITLNRALRPHVNAAGMEYGIDIPFWFDVTTPEGEQRFTVAAGGKRQPLLDAIFECVQNIGIMSYRERVTGPNGSVALCQREFALGRKHGVEVYAALEVGVGPNVEAGTTLGPYSMNYIESQIDTIWQALKHEPGCSGLALHYYGGFQKLETNDAR